MRTLTSYSQRSEKKYDKLDVSLYQVSCSKHLSHDSLHFVSILSFMYPISFVDLLSLVNRSSTPNPNSKMISEVWDFKKWMEPFLGAVRGHSKYLAFQFTLDSSSRAEMHYKRFSSLAWEPEDSGIHVLSVRTFIVHVYMCVMCKL